MINNNMSPTSTEIVNFDNLHDKIHVIRGVQVMLDYDLAEIYGYTTSAFNQQVIRNLSKFDEDFRFQLTKEELAMLGSRSQNVILNKPNFSRSKKLILNEVEPSRSKNLTLNNGRGSNTKYLPHAFTEQGIYMLMTVLRGDLATKQSKALIRTFHAMKTYITDNQEILSYKSELNSLLKLITDTKDLEQVKTTIEKLNSEIKAINQKLENTLMKSDISPILLDFSNTAERKEFIIFNGELAKASETYIDLYAKAKNSIHIIDDYINIKTLRHLQNVKPNIPVTIFSDNVGRYLHASDYADFCQEFPEIKLKFIKTRSLVHDRFIILDYNMETERIFHCGASSKDAGKKITVINELDEELIHTIMQKIIENLSANPELILK